MDLVEALLVFCYNQFSNFCTCIEHIFASAPKDMIDKSSAYTEMYTLLVEFECRACMG